MARPAPVLLGGALSLLVLGGVTLYLLRSPPQVTAAEEATPAEAPPAAVSPPSRRGSDASASRAAAPQARPTPARPEPPRPAVTPGPSAPPGPAPVRNREEVERERRERVVYFKTQLATLRERVARIERALTGLERAGHGDREPARQFRQELESARRAEPRMKRHLEQAEWEVRYGALPPLPGSK